MAKDKEYNRLIHTTRWLCLRRAKLSAQPLCERCSAEGRVRAATEVHHVVPVEDALSPADMRRLMFDPHNLRSLCHECHVRTHTEMGRSGKEQNVRRQSARLADFRKRFMPDKHADKTGKAQ